MKTRFPYRLAMVLAVLLAPAAVLAQAIPFPVVCNGLAGCGAAPENTLFTHILPAAVTFGVKCAGGGAVVAIVISGVRMLLSNGDEGKVASAKKSLFLAFGGLGLVLTSATIVSFVVSEDYGQGNPTGFVFSPGGLLTSTLRIVLTLFNIGFVIMVMIAGLRMVIGAGSPEEFKKGGEIIKWAIVGAIIVNLARVAVGAFLNLDL